MTLLIQDQDVQKLLPMRECIHAMEETFKQFGSGIAVNRPRLRFDCSSPVPGMRYWQQVHIGAVPKYGTACIRVDALVRSAEAHSPAHRSDYAQSTRRSYGFVLLYSLETAELLAIIHDFTLSGIRVAATTALGARYLARGNSEVLGILGTGKMARQHAEAISEVLPIKKIKVYSPSEQHRDEFIKEIGVRLNLNVTPENEARAVVEGSDLVCCATNSRRPVFSGEWLTCGQFVSTIVNTDVLGLKTEADETVFTKSDIIVINDKESVFSNNQNELLQPIEKGMFGWDKVHELGEILNGQFQGRRNGREIIYFKNNTGLAIQFAAASALVYREAQRQKIGIELPTDWFGTDLASWYERGYFPSP